MKSATLARRPAVLLALGLCAFGGVVTLLGRLASGPVVEQKRTAFTTETGTQAYPSFSPDGQKVAYSAQVTADEGFHVFVRPVTAGAATQLTNGSANDVGPVWSPDGATLAFLRVDEGKAQVILLPSAGGAERKVTEFDAVDDESVPTPSIAWTKDGQSLAVVVGGEKQVPSISMLSVKTGALQRITTPPEGSQGDNSPAISPDGKALAFVRKVDQDHADIFLCDLNGAHPRPLTFDSNLVRGLTWSIAGQDVIYASDRGPGWRLWRLPAYGGSPREVFMAGNHASYPAIAPKGYRMAFTESPNVSAIWLAHLGSLDEPQERQAIRSAARETGAAWSPDGTKVASVSEQSGAPEIWVGNAKGGDRVQITRLDGPRMRNPRWSPDGNTILFETRGQNGLQLYTVPAAGGKVTRIMGDAFEASWSRDGKSIVFSSGPQIWRAAADGSDRKRLTRRFGSGFPEESADGKWVFYWSRGRIWRTPSDASVEGDGEKSKDKKDKEEEFIVPDHDLVRAPMHAVKTGLYYSVFDRSQRAMVIEFYDFASAKSEPVLRVKDADLFDGFSISPDGKWVLYPKTDRRQTNLAMIENFR
jgi:Tol biopolymer transport system component